MNSEDVIKFIQKYEDGQASPEERALLESWYNQKASHRLQNDFPNDFVKIKAHALAEIMATPVKGKIQALKPRKKYLREMGIAASLFIILGLGLFLYNRITYDKFAGVHIPPGKSQAILTLADGKKVLLKDAAKGNLAEQAGITITKTADGQLMYSLDAPAGSGPIAYNSIQTPRAGQQAVLLQDGTRIYLNSASSLRFPSTFSGLDYRKVELTGEAYFEVAKDARHPFIVVTKHQNLEVLGTHFNLSSYEEDGLTKTTLLEGSVKITPADVQLKEVKLIPGEQATINSSSATVVPGNPEEAIAWKNGYFRFNDEKIESVMRKIARWYDIEVEYTRPLNNEGINGTISRFTNISDVLRMLEKTKAVHFKVEGRRVMVMQ